MKLFKIVGIILFLFVTDNLQAQIITGGTREDLEVIMEYVKRTNQQKGFASDIDGSPYLYSEFKPAQLQFPTGQTLNANVRYDVAREQMQIYFKEDDSYGVLHSGVVVQLGNILYKTFSYRADDNVNRLGYFAVLTPDSENQDIILLQKHLKNIQPAKPAAPMRDPTPKKYIDKSDYYIKFQDSSPVIVERRRKNFVTLFPEEHQQDIDKYIKQNKLKPKKEEDLKNIVNYYNAHNSGF